MGKTISEKILARAAGEREVSAGDIITANVDIAMMDDILGPRIQIAEGMSRLCDCVWDASKVVVISDHYTPPATIHQAEIVKFTREWSEKHGIHNYYEYVGPCHQIMAEEGWVRPGKLILGTDSHTCMGGAFGAFTTGIGSTEMMGVLISGTIWLKVPETILVHWEGTLSPGVMAKDISLKTIGDIGHAGATYKTVEYAGDTVSAMAMDGRMALCNMAVEMGAKAGIIAADRKTEEFLRIHGSPAPFEPIESDVDAAFCRSLAYDASRLEPMVACPHQVDNVCTVKSCDQVKISQAYIGSCTGGRYEDLEAACRVLKGRVKRPEVRLLVSPASQRVYKAALKDGLLGTLADAGATILAPTCGVCVGLHSGILADGETCISATNRNFIGRMGGKGASIYLGSPMTAAASAVTGRITDPRDLI